MNPAGSDFDNLLTQTRNPPMEMHQIKYFLAVSRTLNFTRAADECHVTQPSLTRAIKQLEAELGGDLFRRERSLSHLTELGGRMLPLIRQCYESAHSAKALAESINSGEISTLRLGLSRTINIELLVPHLTELTRSMKGLELTFVRRDTQQIMEALKKGEVELAVGCFGAENWERLESWPLFSEGFSVVVSAQHRLAGRNGIDLQDLKGERLLVRPYCERSEQFATLLRDAGIANIGAHEVDSDNDMVGLLVANAGIALLPRSTRIPLELARVAVDRLERTRSVAAYAVAGRPRSVAAATLLKLLRIADWRDAAPTSGART